ncbi:MAG: helix-turn-helix domain-containing protein [Verrucomicrobiota bacterium]
MSIVRPDVSPVSSHLLPTAERRRLYRVREAAELLDVSRTTVRNLIECGQLEAGHVGRSANGRRLHLRITAASLDAYLRARFQPDGQPFNRH